jgi:aspartyl-tRNA synthetase
MEAMARSGGMYRAFHYGAPPHGGMAAGLDCNRDAPLRHDQPARNLALLDEPDLLMGAPSEVTTKQLRELHIRLNLPDK